MKTNKILGIGADEAWLATQVLERFCRYVKVHTTSNPHEETAPSSPGQWNLARLLVDELKELGLENAALSDSCYVTARLPSNLPEGRMQQPLAFVAHLDTSPDCSGENVRPQVHKSWDGSPIRLCGGVVLDPATEDDLAKYAGKDIITSDGTTLLGADDKAGVAEIMTALAWLGAHPEVPHPEIEVLFTPDEEIGRGTAHMPEGVLRSRFAFTLDGEDEGSYNVECFNGWSVDVRFTGRMIHPGSARGQLVNPVTMAAAFVANLPRSESPEATDGAYGYYCPQEIRGNMEETLLTLFIRDFQLEGIERRLEFLRRNASLIEASFPGGTARLSERKQYLNMYEGIRTQSRLEAFLRKAISDAGMEPRSERIRGGTDGARMTEMGIITPNIFAGGHNFHSLKEWVPLQSMTAACRVIINLAQAWSEWDMQG